MERIEDMEIGFGREQKMDRISKRDEFTSTDHRVARLNSKERVEVKDPRLELRTISLELRV